jgi:hypothetical protein
MNPRLTGRVIAGAATVLALAGGGVAYAASGDGATTPSRAQTKLRHEGPRAGAAGFGGPVLKGPGGDVHAPGLGGPVFGAGGFDIAGAAADYLGLDVRELHTRLADGRSLADVANAEGKSVTGLQDAIVAAATTSLDRAVDDGWLGAKARDAILERLRDHVDELVAETLPAPPKLGRFERPGGPGGPRGLDCRPAPDRAGRDAQPGATQPGRGAQPGATQPGDWDGAAAGGAWS